MQLCLAPAPFARLAVHAGRARISCGRGALAVRASAQKQPAPLASVDDANINPYCSLDDQGNRIAPLTLGEKEQAFLEALSSFYYDGKPAMTDEEFDMLKDELVWSGSRVAVLSSDEQRFLEAQIAFNKGKPLMSDTDFDALKLKLRRENSIITAEGPRCSLTSRKMYSTATVDYIKLLALNVPAALLVLGALFSVDDITGFEITKFLELPGALGVFIVWGVTLPTIYVLASSITSLVFKDALILKAPCPSCGTENTTYFGDILTVAGNRKKNVIACSNCKAQMKFDADRREVVVEEGGEASGGKPAAA
ncbi:PGR5 1A [Micractinium conductrix]|uniref:PGR5 1A n=1 Tax=Micractinium conductrix TaxID=554055 RepID=A0A2P6V6V4_9CHLO|nr:PGR5 1A [Micractinium conductrix]|eukprot:PSC69824.1 PGR5 1A [Micractinium conductrix]